MQIGYIGLGKMGLNMVTLMLEKGHSVVAFNLSPEPIQKAVELGAVGAESLEDLSNKLTETRVFWLMVPHGAVDSVLADLSQHLREGDVVIDGGNSFYKDSMRRGADLAKSDVSYLDAGISGGPEGARNGASVMVGGSKEHFDRLEQLFADISVENGYAYIGKSGAGHFVKMVHNGIEYGMMQAIAEGFDVMRKSEFDLDFREVMKPYKNGSVISSSLVNWLDDAFEEYGNDLEKISDKASHLGEGQWTVETAEELGIPVKVIKESLQARIDSQSNPNFQARLISAMRGEFGGHPVLKDDGNN